MIPRRRKARKRWVRLCLMGLLMALPGVGFGSPPPDWPQWGNNPQHTGAASAAGQPLQAILTDFAYDPFVEDEKAATGGELLGHFPVPLVDGPDVYMIFKSGVFTGQGNWFSQIWNVQKLRWNGGRLEPEWVFVSDWTPVPLTYWEPVFQGVLAGDAIYVPGSGGSVFRVSKATGAGTRINPFGALDSSRYVAGGLAADKDGAIVYNAVTATGQGWLVRIAPDGSTATADFTVLVPSAPRPDDLCPLGIGNHDPPPWPPPPPATFIFGACGAQRPVLNVVPAIAPDGTIYTVSRADQNDRSGYLVAVRPDLTPAWSASFANLVNDGCDVTIPPSGSPGGCRAGATRGVDPATGDPPIGRLSDQATSSPVVLPDGSVLFGVYTRYNYARGHLFKFDAAGGLLATYDFGWDITPAVRAHDGTYSILTKDNHYALGPYCSGGEACPPEAGRIDITSLDPNLVPEWRFSNTNDQSCARESNGGIVCEASDEIGFEWCVNQPAIDADGVIYAISEDGSLYAVGPDGRLRDSIFLSSALGAAYTPVSIGPDGRIYAQNNGHLFVVGLPVAARQIPAAVDRARPPTRQLERP
ncbi:MAG: hypothetical protein ABI968_05195 [Acidobacteriota bacterium]